jgi:hypothetical protein
MISNEKYIFIYKKVVFWNSRENENGFLNSLYRMWILLDEAYSMFLLRLKAKYLP